ncbi:hypothetical protein EV363DRAFT_1339301 [Boletus edulis]|uniref:Secreted protein n=1 Tax=Boletus edulis BED1 TaxID=1328754 RepID=A0AAD4GN35_BOLED|nr:hypothetical protein EV363DRAFT_1339301 [Boletus edulis]KAF8452334.1 hypothetical protein L210DRAFT_3755456 [Boletus edulis BED1]
MPPRIVMLLYGFLRGLFCCGCNLEARGAVPEENASRRNTQATRLHVIVDDPSDVTFTTPKPPVHQEIVDQSNLTPLEIVGQNPAVGREKNSTRGADGEDFEHVSHPLSISEMNKEKSRPAITQEGSSRNQCEQAFTRGPDVDLEHNRRSTVYFDAPNHFPTTALGDDGAAFARFPGEATKEDSTRIR